MDDVYERDRQKQVYKGFTPLKNVVARVFKVQLRTVKVIKKMNDLLCLPVSQASWGLLRNKWVETKFKNKMYSQKNPQMGSLLLHLNHLNVDTSPVRALLQCVGNKVTKIWPMQASWKPGSDLYVYHWLSELTHLQHKPDFHQRISTSSGLAATADPYLALHKVSTLLQSRSVCPANPRWRFRWWWPSIFCLDWSRYCVWVRWGGRCYKSSREEEWNLSLVIW